jgi:hypothetical protein
MSRQRSAVLLHFYQTHGPALGWIHSHIRDAVPAAYGLLAELGTPWEIAGTTLGNIVREFTIKSTKRSTHLHLGGLTFAIGPNRSIVFGDAEGRKVRVRKQPIDWKRRRLVPLPRVEQLETIPVEQLELLRRTPSLPGEELTILWKPDPAAGALGKAILASVRDLENSSKTRVLDFAELPGPPDGAVGSPDVPPQPEPGDYEEFFGDTSGIIGPDSA